MAKEIKTIGVLTSGGDAPGMNAAVRAIVRAGISKGYRMMGIQRGYNGLINGEVYEMNVRSVSEIIHRGGTILYTARCLEFKTKEGQAKGLARCKELGIEWDRCTMWEAMPILTEDGEEFGRVGNVEFLKQSGKVTSIIADKGAFDKALLGQLEIPAAYIRGFKLGVGGTEIVNDAEPEEGEVQTGAILVSDEVRDIAVEGGLAEKGGKAAAVAQNKVNEAKEKAAPKVHEAAHAANEASQKAAYVTGRQIGRTKGMFTDFKNNFDKALNGEDDGEAKGK